MISNVEGLEEDIWTTLILWYETSVLKDLRRYLGSQGYDSYVHIEVGVFKKPSNLTYLDYPTQIIGVGLS